MGVTDSSSGVIQALVVDGKVRAYRSDGEPLTERDWQNISHFFHGLPEPPTVATPIPAPADMPLFCRHCFSAESTPPWRRNGKVVLRTWPNRTEWACNYCGRAL
jgi:hypothetical protein